MSLGYIRSALDMSPFSVQEVGVSSYAVSPHVSVDVCTGRQNPSQAIEFALPVLAAV